MLIDTHRHFGGSIPKQCVWEIIQRKDLHWLAESYEDVVAQMTFAPEEPRTFHRFLDKFRILDEITWDQDLIDLSIRSTCETLEQEEIDYCWLDFSINKYMRIGWHKTEAIQFIHERFEHYRPNRVGLILSLKYESMQASQRQYAALIEDPNIADLLFGLDLVGDENHYEQDFYKPILKTWRDAGKMVRAHVGEFGSAKNIQSAINSGVTNIAHGIKIIHQLEVMKLARDNDICFDVAPTSNALTGVLDSEFHPMMDMLFADLKLTIGSDDPIQCDTTLKQEYEIAKQFGLDDDQLDQLKQQAIQMTRHFNPEASLD